jgi:membrane protease YdiL (CAAX protease family)
MNLTPFDHILAFLLVAFIPLWGLRDKRRLLAGLRLGSGDARVRAYRRIAAVSWLLLLGMLAIWLSAGRDLRMLGLAFEPGPRALIGAAVAVAASGLLVLQMVVVQRSPEKLDAVLTSSSRSSRCFPTTLASCARSAGSRSRREFARSSSIARNLIAYFWTFVGIWPAAGLAAVAFGIAHAYQGVTGMIKTGVVGVIMGVLYLLSGSIWGPMLLHAMVDITSGGSRTARCIGKRCGSSRR